MTSFDLLLGGYGIPVPPYQEIPLAPPQIVEQAATDAHALRELDLADHSVEVALFLGDAVYFAPHAVKKHYPQDVIDRACDKVRHAITLRTIQANRTALRLSVDEPKFVSEETLCEPMQPAAEKQTDDKEMATGDLPGAKYVPEFDDDDGWLADNDAQREELAAAALLRAEQEREAMIARANRFAAAAYARRAAAVAQQAVQTPSAAVQSVPDGSDQLTADEIEEKRQSLEDVKANLAIVASGEQVTLGRQERAFIIDACRKYDHVRCQTVFAKRDGLHVSLDEVAQKAAEQVVEVPIESIVGYRTLRSKVSVFAGRLAARIFKSSTFQSLVEAAEYMGQSDVYLLQ